MYIKKSVIDFEVNFTWNFTLTVDYMYYGRFLGFVYLACSQETGLFEWYIFLSFLWCFCSDMILTFIFFKRDFSYRDIYKIDVLHLV